MGSRGERHGAAVGREDEKGSRFELYYCESLIRSLLAKATADLR